jgi:hypothetical protein
MSSIYDFVKKQRNSYRSDTITIADGYEFAQYDTLRTIELYHNSRFTTGSTASLGHDKSFFNFCKFRANVAVRATDLDTKDVQIESERIGPKGFAASFILKPQEPQLDEAERLRQFLNGLGQTRAK